MFYQKNVPSIERVVRILLGMVMLGMVIAGVGFQGGSLIGKVAVLFSAGFVMITGFIGWCPACAMVGRKLKEKRS
jgi:hypothetical protein